MRLTETPMTESTHLCLVSNQPTPNLTPALDPDLAPRRVILLVSPDMTRRAEALEAVLKPRGISVARWPIQEAWDVEHIQQRVLELLEQESALIAPRAIALNATGGTKPMSIAAYEAFRAYDLPIFYVHPEHDRLIWLHPADRPAVDIANRVRLDAFLLAHGARLEASVTQPVSAPHQALNTWLVANVQHLARPLGTLNWLANRAERELLSPALEPHQLRDPDLAELLDRFADAGLLRLEQDRLRFPHETARGIVNGGWLEGHVYTVFADLKREDRRIQDLARTVQIVRRDARGALVPNELDVTTLMENRLYLIECKTRGWRDDGPTDGPGAEALYKLDTLADLLGGLQARAMLVSYLDLSADTLRRAADLRIRVCAGARLPELRQHLADWLPRTRG
jgi:hypothetical protein